MTGDLKKFCTCGDDGWASWSNLNHDLLFLIVMHMGVFDFIAFSGVCKSWRSVAVSNWNKFMVSKQPMRLYISTHLRNKDCYLEDYKKRKLKTVIPHSNGRKCVGITCGYLIFFGRKTHDFWLVDPFTRKELHFPRFPSDTHGKASLVFSPSMFGWVLLVILWKSVSFSLAGKRAKWRSVSANFHIYSLHFSKGKLYILNASNASNHLWELRLHPEPTLTPLEMKNRRWLNITSSESVSTGEKLYLMDTYRDDIVQAIEVDLDEMKWVNSDKTIRDYAIFISDFWCKAAIKPDTWTHPWTRYERYNCFLSNSRDTTRMWYFPYECLIDNASDMEDGALRNILQE